MNATLLMRFDAACSSRPTDVFCLDEDATWTFAEAESASYAIALAIKSRRTPGSNDIVALYLPKSALYAVTYVACLRAGALIAPVGELDGARPDLRDLGKLEPPIILTTREGAHQIARSDSALLKRVLVVDSTARATAREAANFEPEGRVDCGVLIATSGSTGSPRRVHLPEAALMANAAAHIRSVLDDQRTALADERALISISPAAGYCNTVQIVGQLLTGGSLAFSSRKFSPVSFVENVQRMQVTQTVLVPAMLRLLGQFETKLGPVNSSLKQICFGGQQVEPAELDGVQRMFPSVELIETYGLTEAGPRIATLRARDRQRHPGTVGRLLEHVTFATGDPDTGEILDPGRPGEILVKSPGVMTGYFNDPHATNDAFKNGWLRTGDIGYATQHGMVVLNGRWKNAVHVAGRTVQCEDVERALSEVPGVKSAAAYGVPHATYGEALEALVTVGSEFRVDAARDKLQSEFGVATAPRRFTVVDAIPRTPNGKIDRAALRNYAATLSAEGIR